MRLLLVLSATLILSGGGLAGCGLECGDGTEEKDGDCVPSDGGLLNAIRIASECEAMCGLRSYNQPCCDSCELRATGAATLECQTCIIAAYDFYIDPELFASAQEACLPYCTE